MAPLQKRVIDVPFNLGPDDKINPHLRQASQLSLLEHCYQQKTGQVRKRNGISTLTSGVISGTTITTTAGLYTRGEELLVHDGDTLYSWSPTTPGWQSKGECPSVDISARSLSYGPRACDQLDSASTGPWLCYSHNLVLPVWGSPSEPANSCITLIDTVNDMEVISSLDLRDGATARNGVVAPVTSSVFAVTYNIQAGNILHTKLLSGVGTNPTLGAFSVAASDMSATFDRLESGAIGSEEYYVAYVSNAGNVTVRVYDSSGTNVHTNIAAPAGAVVNFSTLWEPTHSCLYVFFWDTTGGLKVIGFTEDLATTGVGFTVQVVEALAAGESYGSGAISSGLDPDDTTQVRVFWETDDASISTSKVRTALVKRDTGVVSAQGDFIRNCHLVSYPFTIDDKLHVFVHITSPANLAANSAENHSAAGSIYCVRYDAGDTAFVARFLVDQHPGAATGIMTGAVSWTTGLTVRRVFEESSTRVRVPFLRAERASLITTAGGGGVDRHRYDTSVAEISLDFTKKEMPSAEVNGVLLLGGGCLRVYDGDGVYLAGLEMRHLDFQLDNIISGTGSLADGDYGVAIAYRWIDGVGNEYWSAPQFETITVAAAGVAGTEVIRTYQVGPPTESWLLYNGLTDKSNVDIVVARTILNGSVHYIESIHPNDTTAYSAVVSLGDTVTPGSDADIVKNSPIYTTGGVLAYVLPPAPHHLASDGDTVALVPGDKRDTVWVSTPVLTGEGVRFTDDLVYDTPEGGDNEAVWFMDGRLILFKGRQIRYMIGQAPNALGQFGYQGSELITSDVGCEDWRSMARVPQGIIFKSAKGFYLLGRDLQVSYVGSPVESYNDQTVKSCSVLSDENHVRFCMSGGDVIVWDYEHNIWPRWPSMGFVSSVIWDGTWVVSKTSGRIGQEDSSAWVDYGVDAIEMKVRTGWLEMSALQGYERIRRIILLGQNPDIATPQHVIALNIYSDFNEVTAVQSTALTAITHVQNTPLMIRTTLEKQKMSAIMAEIVMRPKTTTNECATLTGVSFEAGAKKGAQRLSADYTK